jgi:hypothetical protein
MSPLGDFTDRLARLTYLCSEISKAAKGEQVPLDRLRDVLREAEDLCRAVRKEIARRLGEDSGSRNGLAEPD